MTGTARPVVLPLTSVQRGIAFHSSYEDGADPYVGQLWVEVDVAMDKERLARACADALSDLPNLRGRLRSTLRGEAVLVVTDDVGEGCTFADVASAREAEDRCAREVARGVHLTDAPHVRFLALHLPSGAVRVVVTFHHLVLDGWSAGLLLQHVVRHYLGAGTTVPPPYSRHLRLLAGDDEATAAMRWADALRGPATLLGGEASPREERGEIVEEIGTALTTQLSEAARVCGTTVATLVHAAWAMAVGLVAGTRAPVFGAVVSGRSPELDRVDEMIGMFANTVGRRVHIGETARDVARALWQQQADLVDVEHVSLGAVTAAVERGALFDTLVNVNSQGRLFGGAGAPGIRITATGGTSRSHYPLVLDVALNDVPSPHMVARVQYAASCALVARSLRNGFRAALKALADDAPPPSADGPIPDDRPEPPSVTARWRAAVSMHADRPAIEENGFVVTFRELALRVAEAGERLTAKGLDVEDTLAIALPRGVDHIAVTVAARLAGITVFPLDPEWTAERRADALNRFAVRAVAETAVDEWELTGAAARARRVRQTDAAVDRSAAYLIATSGTTGEPKGVVVPAPALAAQLDWLTHELALGPGDVVLWRTSPAFDASVWEMWAPLLAGATVRVLPSSLHADVTAIRRALDGVTVAQFAPTVLARVLDDGHPLPDSMRLLACGGEPLTPDLVARARRGADLRVLNLYGPAETTIQVCAASVLTTPGAVAVGHPIPRSYVVVLSDELLPTAPGVRGEIWVGGAQVARGYRADAARTAATFVASPLPDRGGRWYRTGDLGYVNAVGELVVVGRRDRQVKVRGRRVELEELETVGRERLGEPVVMALRNVDGVDLLVAYVAGEAHDPDAVRTLLAEVLPVALVPDAIVPVRALPTTPSGKVDHAALARLELPEAQNVRMAGDPEVVSAIAEAMAVALGREGTLPADADFFQLGGDSIAAMTLVSRVREAGHQLTPRDVFEARTPERLAARLRPDDATSDDGVGDFPALPFVRDAHCAGTVGFQVLVLAAPSDLTEETLRRMLTALVARHPALRARVRATSSGLAYIVGPHSAKFGDLWQTSPHDLADRASLVAEADAVVAELAAQLDASAGHVLAAKAIADRTGCAVAVVIVLDHHVTDGYSLRLIQADLRRLWENPATSLPPARGASLRTWSTAVAAAGPDNAAVESIREGRRLLARMLGGVTAVPVNATDAMTLRLSAVEVRALAQLAGRSAGFRLDAVLLAALALALQDDALAHGQGTLRRVAVDIERHGRDLLPELDVSATVGWFTAGGPLTIDLSDIDSHTAASAASLRRLFADVAADLAMTPAAQLAQERAKMMVDEERSRTLVFNYLGVFDGGGEEAGPWSALAEESEDGTAAFPSPTHLFQADAVLWRMPRGERLDVRCAWDREVLGDRGRTLSERWGAVLRDLAASGTAAPVAPAAHDPEDLAWADALEEEGITR